MTIHVVKAGETLAGIAAGYGTTAARLALDNGVPGDGALAVGQALLVRFPQTVHVVREGETLSAIGRLYGVTPRQLLRRNWGLGGSTAIRPGQVLVISYLGEKLGSIAANGYAYPYIPQDRLRAVLPYMTFLTPFTYGLAAGGGLLPLEDEAMLEAARSLEVLPLLHLSALTEEGQFSGQRGGETIASAESRRTAAEEAAAEARARGYRGIDVDFEYLPAEYAQAYIQMIYALRRALEPGGGPVLVALAPKTRADQPGLLYEAHDYRGLGEAADGVLLMTYEWGYAYGPPMAVSPLPSVRQVLEYAVSEIEPLKILMGLSNYGYDWPLPYRQGVTRATSLSTVEAVALAVRYGAEIQYDQDSAAPWFNYRDQEGTDHVVWFEDCRSWSQRLRLPAEFRLGGIGVWNLMRENPQGWNTLDALWEIRDLA